MNLMSKFEKGILQAEKKIPKKVIRRPPKKISGSNETPVNKIQTQEIIQNYCEICKCNFTSKKTHERTVKHRNNLGIERKKSYCEICEKEVIHYDIHEISKAHKIKKNAKEKQLPVNYCEICEKEYVCRYSHERTKYHKENVDNLVEKLKYNSNFNSNNNETPLKEEQTKLVNEQTAVVNENSLTVNEISLTDNFMKLFFCFSN